MKKWEGKTRGGVIGYKIFIFIIKFFGLTPAYILLIFVASYFFIFTSKKYIFFYYHTILKYSLLKSFIGIYKSYLNLGQILIDKNASLSGFAKKISYDSIGEDSIKRMEPGGILINAHIGNWELAGQFLINVKKRVNILMYDGEYIKIKQYLDSISQNRNYNIIRISDSFSHLIEIDKALKNNEIICMHGDRFVQGASYIEMDFLGRKAKFPTGPFYMAIKFNVPVSFVFSVKHSKYKYFFSATTPKIYECLNSIKARKEVVCMMMKEYISELEKKVLEYPNQWFNFYDFWDIEEK